MARREGHIRGEGYHSSRDMGRDALVRDKTTDNSGNPVARPRVIPVDKVQNNGGYSGTVSDKDN